MHVDRKTLLAELEPPSYIVARLARLTVPGHERLTIGVRREGPTRFGVLTAASRMPTAIAGDRLVENVHHERDEIRRIRPYAEIGAG